MKTLKSRWNLCRVLAIFAVTIISFSARVDFAQAASWNGIEPLKSRREDVLKILGKPSTEDANGALEFSVAGGTALIVFVDQKFVTNKKLHADLEGTVLEIVLQHDHSTDTPESLKLLKNHDFVSDDIKSARIFRNLKDGIVYTFIDGRLHTTRMTFSENDLGRARR